MSGFREFLEDYAAKESEDAEKFYRRLAAGKFSHEDTYPAKDRFFNLKEPVATSGGNRVWGVVPFYGSTIVSLLPRDTKIEFDRVHENFGFTSKNIDEMIDLVKTTGRIQFAISGDPRCYLNLDFLEPLFTELTPPLLMGFAEVLIGPKKCHEYVTEFDTLANFGFAQLIKHITFQSGITDKKYLEKRLGDYSFDYAAFKSLGYIDLADELGFLMITNPPKALDCFNLLGNLIAVPQYDPLKSIHNFDETELHEAQSLATQHNLKVSEYLPCEIGKFLLNKIVRYPETIDGCMKIIQEYEAYELNKVLNNLNEGIKKNDKDMIHGKTTELSEIFDNVWDDANRVTETSKRVNYGVSLSIGLVGHLASGLPEEGLLAALGFQVFDKFLEVKNESISEKIAKFICPNYLVAIYDFKKQLKK